jgi:putative ABC transport system permease protein
VQGLPYFGYAAIALLVIGVVMLMPRIAVLCFRAAPLAGPVPARVGLAQLRGAPGQTGVSLAAIVAAVSLMVSMAIMVASFRQSLDEWLEHVLPADVYLRTGADTAFLSPADQREIAALPGVRRADFQRNQRVFVSAERPPIALLARAVEGEGRMPPLVGAPHGRKPGDPPPAWVSEIASDLYGWRPGGIIELPLGGRRVRFLVAGVWRDYARQRARSWSSAEYRAIQAANATTRRMAQPDGRGGFSKSIEALLPGARISMSAGLERSASFARASIAPSR